jgi:hypothetical protein
MAGMGFGGGVSDLTKSDLPLPKVASSGVAAFLMWRSVYLTKQLSYTNMILSEYSSKNRNRLYFLFCFVLLCIRCRGAC